MASDLPTNIENLLSQVDLEPSEACSRLLAALVPHAMDSSEENLHRHWVLPSSALNGLEALLRSKLIPSETFCDCYYETEDLDFVKDNFLFRRRSAHYLQVGGPYAGISSSRSPHQSSTPAVCVAESSTASNVESQKVCCPLMILECLRLRLMQVAATSICLDINRISDEDDFYLVLTILPHDPATGDTAERCECCDANFIEAIRIRDPVFFAKAGRYRKS